MWPNPQFPAAFTKEILNEKLLFLCSEVSTPSVFWQNKSTDLVPKALKVSSESEILSKWFYLKKRFSQGNLDEIANDLHFCM